MRINPDSPFVHITGAIFDSVVVTALFLICCLPVVTIGASATALHSVMLRIASGESKGVLRPFFQTFQADFKLSTALWLPALAVGAVVAGDIYVCFGFQMEQTLMLSVMQGLTVGCAALYFGVLPYLFAGVSRFEVTFSQALRNALLWTVKKPLHTLGLLALGAAIVFAVYLAWIWAFPAVVLLLYLRAMILNDAFGFTPLPDPRAGGNQEEIYYE